jgi:formate hydrogenlyase subunit 3/multisubunit Na+/H+ antiporter MnhD subunit
VTAIPGPVILLAVPLLAAGATYLVRRIGILAALIAVVSAGALAILCLRLPLDRSAFILGQEVAFGRPVVILGRNMMLESTGQAWLAYVFSLATVFYLFAGWLSQGRSFFPFSLVILDLYVLVALSRSFPMAIILFAISAAPAIFIIQGGRPYSVRGAQRYLLITLLAVPATLAAAWLVEQAALDPAQIALARQALLPAAFGFGLLLAAIPFGTWMPAVAADAPPIITAFIFTAGQGMAIFLLVTFLQNDPLALADPTTAAVAQLAGLIMVVGGGLIAAMQRDFGRLLGYAALSDLGYFLLAWGTGSSQSLDLALLHMVNRAIPIALMAAALAILRHRATTDSFGELGGVARRLPISTAGLVLGGLALAGFPLTAGFPTHWAIARAILGGQWAWETILPLPGTIVVLLLLFSSACITIGLLRGLGAMLGERSRPDVAAQPVVASAIVLVLAGIVIVIGLYPQLFLTQAQALF